MTVEVEAQEDWPVFKDVFTGRMLESVTETNDEQGKRCVMFKFSGTNQKLHVYPDLACEIWIDDDKLRTMFYYTNRR